MSESLENARKLVRKSLRQADIDESENESEHSHQEPRDMHIPRTNKLLDRPPIYNQTHHHQGKNQVDLSAMLELVQAIKPKKSKRKINFLSFNFTAHQ